VTTAPTTATPPSTRVDRGWLARAIATATSAGTRAHPNPAVGCVLVRDGQVVGEGASEPAGGAHAEVVALRGAATRARGATAYVSLEPCAHHGRTPPCTAALEAAGVARVVFVHPDPNPVAAGGGAALRAAGLRVDGPASPDDLLRTAVATQLEGFLQVVHRGRPHVTLKLAQTLDGSMDVPPSGRWITGPAARRAVHRWRAASDAVLVGIGTVLADDPRLDVRTVAAERQPRPVILDTHARTPLDAAVARPGALALVGVGASPGAVDRLRGSGVEVRQVATHPTGHLDVVAALAALADAGITRVFAEPGPRVAASLLAADVVDRVVWHVAPQLGDGPWRPAVALPGRWHLERLGGAGSDVIVQQVRDRDGPGAGAPDGR
jgi:diaminohydroxyphosphoribosylaminopyrimidine deaminase / 5-amino-6-(5-phosphoribosylamino)uracil reductase